MVTLYMEVKSRLKFQNIKISSWKLHFAGWGGGYMDEPISKILTSLGNSSEVRLDRWQLKVLLILII